MGDLIDWNNIVSLGAAALPHLGDPRREFAAARLGAAVTPVTHFDLLRIHGSDAKAFLQGQLTCDLDQVTPDQAQFGGYCTPKGRLLANFMLLSMPQGYLMYTPADVAASVANRLRKFILRSDVKIERESGLRALGLAGPAAPDVLQQELGVPPQGRLAMGRHAHASAVRLPGDNFLVVAASNGMAALWEALAKHAVPAGAECWNWVQIETGVPWITAATQDQFLPQMIGLDAIGGVSFDKGCYTGQEIVARTHYLGEVKRKLCLGRTRGGVRAGDALLAAGQQCGTVLNTASIPGDGWALLAVVSEQAAAQAVQIASGEPVDLSAPPGAAVPG
ncbi:MAG: folate-binding protein YgfZ [Betaproteobacteria bacterium]|nr:folate-binding protein YgfZ [Betaproteobacteria bacterium]